MPQTRKNAKTAAHTHTSTGKHTWCRSMHTHTHSHTHTHTTSCRRPHRHAETHTENTDPVMHILPSLLSSHTLDVLQNVYVTRWDYLKKLSCRQFDFSPALWRERRRENTRCSRFSRPVQKVLFIFCCSKVDGADIVLENQQLPVIDGKVQFDCSLVVDSRSQHVKPTQSVSI